MKKKTIFIILSVIAVAILLIIFAVPPLVLTNVNETETEKTCVFCKPEVIERQQYYEGQLIRVLYNYYPMLPGHSLIIPKRQAERFEDLTDAEITEMMSTVKKVQKAFEKVYKTSDYILLMQNGKKAGQTVFHVHFHMIPRTSLSYLTKLRIWLHFLSRPVYENSLSSEELIKEKTPLHNAMLEISPEYSDK